MVLFGFILENKHRVKREITKKDLHYMLRNSADSSSIINPNREYLERYFLAGNMLLFKRQFIYGLKGKRIGEVCFY